MFMKVRAVPTSVVARKFYDGKALGISSKSGVIKIYETRKRVRIKMNVFPLPDHTPEGVLMASLLHPGGCSCLKILNSQNADTVAGSVVRNSLFPGEKIALLTQTLAIR